MFTNDNYLIFAENAGLFSDSSDKGISFKLYDYKTKDINTINFKSDYLTDVTFKDDMAFILSNKDKLEDLNCYVIAIDLNKGKIVWDVMLKDEWGLKVKRSYAEGSKSLCIVTSNAAYIINEENGNIKHTISIGESLVNIYAFVSVDKFISFG